MPRSSDMLRELLPARPASWKKQRLQLSLKVGKGAARDFRAMFFLTSCSWTHGHVSSVYASFKVLILSGIHSDFPCQDLLCTYVLVAAVVEMKR